MWDAACPCTCVFACVVCLCVWVCVSSWHSSTNLSSIQRAERSNVGPSNTCQIVSNPRLRLRGTMRGAIPIPFEKGYFIKRLFPIFDQRGKAGYTIVASTKPAKLSDKVSKCKVAILQSQYASKSATPLFI